ncbi:MAG TPA: T9SS type A sorting domain-containing protein [Flavobacterium sp.]|nr:T9SS type A sorting domain-containing protein [Flavobacterium sp.]
MKKITFLIITTFFAFNHAFSQVVYSDDFENYTLGNLGTIPDGQTPGQGGWLTEVKRLPTALPTTADNPLFTITNEPNRGKVLTLAAPLLPDRTALNAKKINLAPLIDNRNTNNNVLKFEIDYYTGSQQIVHISALNSITVSKNTSSSLPQYLIFGISFNPNDGETLVHYNRGENLSLGVAQLSTSNSKLPFNSWAKFIVYLDYANKEIYFETPYFGTVIKKGFLELSTSANLLEDFKPETLQFNVSTSNIISGPQMINKYDNIKITALNKVPAHIVSANSFLSEQFTIFPNPASNLVNITNTSNLGVEEVSIYDVSGKLLKTQKVVSTEDIELNIEELATGTYMLQIQTNQGTAVKKIIKK